MQCKMGSILANFVLEQNEARVRVIRKHLVDVHSSWSFFNCNEMLENGEVCDWFCHHGLRCFINHAEIVHMNFFNGKETKLSEEKSVSLELCELDQKVTTHSGKCKEAKLVNRKSNKRFWKKREKLEDIIFEKFVEGSVATDFSEKVKHYKEGFSEYKRLLTEYPRRHNRVTENTTLRNKEFKFHLGEYARLMKMVKKLNFVTPQTEANH